MPRAKQADLLHRVCDSAHLGVELSLAALEQAQRLSHGPRADTVVKRPRHGEVATQQLELVVERDRITDTNELLGGLAGADTDIDEHLVNLRHLGRTSLGAHEVRCNAADNPHHRTLAGVDSNALCLGDRRVGTPEPPHVNVAVIVDEVDRHANLVGVAGEHQPWTAALVEHRDTVAIGIGISLVGVLASVVHPDP